MIIKLHFNSIQYKDHVNLHEQGKDFDENVFFHSKNQIKSNQMR